MTRIGILCLACVVAACQTDAGESPPAMRVDSAGVELVVNPADDRPLRVSFLRELELGGEPDGPASFYRVLPAQVASLPDDGIALLDRQGSRVTVFDAAGTVLVSFGREGDGPGEFRYPASIAALSDGTIAIYDYQKRALQHFTREGAFVAQEAVTDPVDVVRQAPSTSAPFGEPLRRSRRAGPGRAK